MGNSDAIDYRLVVRSDSVHRIQEAQAGLVLELWASVQDALAAREGRS
jgi:hypothetical protein